MTNFEFISDVLLFYIFQCLSRFWHFLAQQFLQVDIGSLIRITVRWFSSRRWQNSLSLCWNNFEKIPRNGMKMMDKENGILWHFVAQHKISIKLITLKIYARSYTRPEVKFEMAPNLTKLAPHELIWCFYTSVWSALIIWTFSLPNIKVRSSITLTPR